MSRSRVHGFAPWFQHVLGLGLVLAASILSAQSYQTAFDTVAFERKTAKRILHGGPSVDPATGVLQLDLPMGPSLGLRGAVFSAALSLRVGAGETGGSFHPGYFDLPHSTNVGGRTSKGGFRIMGGPSGAPETWPSSRTPELATLLPAFGYSAAGASFQGLGSNGELIIHLAGPNGEGPYSLPTWEGPGPSGPLAACVSYPRRILVVSASGESAYEFRFGNAQYPSSPIWAHPCATNPASVAPMQASSQPLAKASMDAGETPAQMAPGGGYENGYNELMGVRYLLYKASNRHQDALVYTFDGNGIGWSVAWTAKGVATGVSVQAVLDTYRQPNSGGAADPGYLKVRVSFPGLNQGDVVLEGYPVGVMTAGPTYYTPWGAALEALRPTRMVYEGDAGQVVEQFDFTWDLTLGAPRNTPRMTLTNLRTLTRDFTFEWEYFTYPRNRQILGWNGFRVGYLDQEFSMASGYGVKTVTARDPQEAGSDRVTRYHRTRPTYQDYVRNDGSTNLTGYIPIWSDTTFQCAVEFPDGSVTLNKYVPPVQNSDGGPSAGAAAQFQTLAHLRHVLWEERKYEAGQDWRSDAPAVAASSIAYEVTRWGGERFSTLADVSGLTQWSTRWLGNALSTPSSGNASFAGPSLYPLLKETWRRERLAAGGSQVITGTEVTTGWDTNGPGWTTLTQTVQHNGLAAQTSTSKTFTSDWSNWFPARVGSAATSQSQDNLEGSNGASAPTLTSATTFRSGTNLAATTRQTAGADFLETSYPDYDANGLPRSATLSGASGGVALTHSGEVGVSRYEYDARGFLSLIQAKQAAFFVQQSQDAVGRVLTQIDAGGRPTVFSYDRAGRLTSITPPGGEAVTTLTYADARSVLVTCGQKVTELLYNGFGDLILERRWKEGVASHRRWGFDARGRRTWETVWASGSGVTTGWSSPASPLDSAGGGHYETGPCSKWIYDPNLDEMVCLAYKSIWVADPPAPSRTHHWYYDSRGRVTRALSAANVAQDIAYDGLDQVITTAAGTTRQRYDAKGRLVEIVDALNQRTRYRYDHQGRVTLVTQYDAAMANSQLRTWEYAPLGWTTRLTQPESGVTTYGEFTVHGLPQLTTFLGDGSTAAKTIRTAIDALGRLKSRTEVGGSSVAQTFEYYSSGSAAGQLAWDADAAVRRDFAYNGATGRLESLTTAVSTAVTGVLSYAQSFTYNVQGQRDTATVAGRQVRLGFDATSGLPRTASFGPTGGTSQVAEAAWNAVSWNLDSLAWSGANGARQDFTYDEDQSRLKSLVSKYRQNGSLTSGAWNYTFDGAGRLTSDGQDSFTYDALNRLKSAQVNNPFTGGTLNQAFEYDAFGNLRGLANSGSANTLDFAGFNFSSAASLTTRNRLPGDAQAGAVYNGQGHLVQVLMKRPGISAKVPVDITYDALGRVIRVSWTASGTKVSEDYSYTAEGLRTLVVRRLNDGATPDRRIVNLYDDNRKLVAQYDGGGWTTPVWKRDVVYMGGKEVAEIGPLGTSITQTDHLGTPRYLLDGTGAVKALQKFTPLGEAFMDRSTMDKFAMGFTSHEQLDPSGLISMQARFYHPGLGRFTSPDPGLDQRFQETQSWNIYSYVQNNPITSIDPTGMVNEDGSPGKMQLTKERLAANKAQAKRTKEFQAQVKRTVGLKKEWRETLSKTTPIPGKDAERKAVGEAFKKAEAKSDAETTLPRPQVEYGGLGTDAQSTVTSGTAYSVNIDSTRSQLPEDSTVKFGYHIHTDEQFYPSAEDRSSVTPGRNSYLSTPDFLKSGFVLQYDSRQGFLVWDIEK